MRSSGEMILFVGLNDVKSVSFQNGKYIFESSSLDAQKMILENRSKILSFLKQNYGITEIDAVVKEDAQKIREEKLSTLLDGKIEIE